MAAEIAFYHLTHTSLEQALPELIERALSRDLKVLVRTGSEARANAIDAMLWTWRDDSFLPHGVAGGPDDARQPVLVTHGAGNGNAATVLMQVDGVRLDPAWAGGFDRACLIFNGHDEAELAAARADWGALTAAGQAAVYWSQESGKWAEKARTG